MSNYYGPGRDEHRTGRGVIWFIFCMLLIAGLLAIPLTYMGFFTSWVTAPTQVFSVDNVRQLSRQANDRRQALDAERANIVAMNEKINEFVATHGTDRSKWPQGADDEYLQLQQQLLNMKTAYNQHCGAYKAMWEDEWRSLPAPDDLDTYCEFTD